MTFSEKQTLLLKEITSLQREQLQAHKESALGPVMSEGAFVIHRYDNNTPTLASCARCQRKFFTPNYYFTDAFGAEVYLREKFDHHECSEEQSRKPRVPTSWRNQ